MSALVFESSNADCSGDRCNMRGSTALNFAYRSWMFLESFKRSSNNARICASIDINLARDVCRADEVFGTFLPNKWSRTLISGTTGAERERNRDCLPFKWRALDFAVWGFFRGGICDHILLANSKESKDATSPSGPSQTDLNSSVLSSYFQTQIQCLIVNVTERIPELARLH